MCSTYLSSRDSLILDFQYPLRNLQSLQRSLPFSSLLPPVVSPLLSLLLITTSITLKQTIFKYLVSFWQQGALGYIWVGKVYFGVSVSASLFLKWYYSWFSPGSKTHAMLKWAIRAVAVIVMVFYASPSIELGCLFALLAVYKEPIVKYSERALSEDVTGHLLVPPTFQVSGTKMLSQVEYIKQGEDYTAKALAELQSHLQNNDSDVYDFTDR